MSLKNNEDTPSYTGGVFAEDITAYSSEELEHEYELSYEILNDVHCSFPPWNGGVAISGLLKQDPDKNGICSRETFLEALATWKARLKRAEDELERRYLLS